MQERGREASVAQEPDCEKRYRELLREGADVPAASYSCYFATFVPVSNTIAARVVWAALRPRRKSLSV